MILDLTAGNRSIWFDKEGAIFLDHRLEVKPTVCGDAACLPFKNGVFDMVVFDPPHVNTGAGSIFAGRYGHYTTAQIRDLVLRAAKETWRVTTATAFMALKWNDHDQRLSAILDMLKPWAPLFGHKVSERSLRRSSTYWVMLSKRGEADVAVL